jgi:hypothetical protein
VLQRDVAPCFAGFAAAGDAIEVAVSDGQLSSGVTGSDGQYKVCLPTPLAVGGPYEVKVRVVGSELEPTVLTNVMSGDVVFCSGQSNMQHRFPSFVVRVFGS